MSNQSRKGQRRLSQRCGIEAPSGNPVALQAFGFEKQLVVPGEDGSIAHAQLTWGNGMMMLGSVRDNDYGKRIKQPDELDGFETQAPYVVVEDADARLCPSGRGWGQDRC